MVNLTAVVADSLLEKSLAVLYNDDEVTIENCKDLRNAQKKLAFAKEYTRIMKEQLDYTRLDNNTVTLCAIKLQIKFIDAILPTIFKYINPKGVSHFIQLGYNVTPELMVYSASNGNIKTTKHLMTMFPYETEYINHAFQLIIRNKINVEPIMEFYKGHVEHDYTRFMINALLGDDYEMFELFTCTNNVEELNESMLLAARLDRCKYVKLLYETYNYSTKIIKEAIWYAERYNSISVLDYFDRVKIE